MDREARNYWRQQAKQGRRNRSVYSGPFGDAPITKVLIGLMVITFGLAQLFPGALYAAGTMPGGVIITYLVAALNPGGFIGLVLDGVFVWLIGSAIEPMARWWQYLLIFWGSALIAAIALHHFSGGFPVSPSLAAFGLAGAYVHVMTTRGIRGAASWALTLLLFNLVLSGFSVDSMIALIAAFGSGFGLAVATQLS